MKESNLFYHGENHDMWMKGCIFLGKFVTERDYKLDLGIWLNPNNGDPSFAIVYGEEGHQYISGNLSVYKRSGALDKDSDLNDYFNETIKRYNEYLKNKGEE
jgi:hypothetical protein